jgi:hypothetical protein
MLKWTNTPFIMQHTSLIIHRTSYITPHTPHAPYNRHHTAQHIQHTRRHTTCNVKGDKRKHSKYIFPHSTPEPSLPPPSSSMPQIHAHTGSSGRQRRIGSHAHVGEPREARHGGGTVRASTCVHAPPHKKHSADKGPRGDVRGGEGGGGGGKRMQSEAARQPYNLCGHWHKLYGCMR